MTRRRSGQEVNLEGWPSFDAKALPTRKRQAFEARRCAIERYAQGTPLTDIETETGVGRRQIYRLLDACSAPHDDGRPWGWRAAVPYARTSTYRRTAPIDIGPEGRGAAGAFGVLLEKHLSLATWMADVVRSKRVALHQVSTNDSLRTRLQSLKPLHIEFLRRCRDLGLTTSEYPFNTERMGIRSLAKAIRARCLMTFGTGARAAGAPRPKGTPGMTSHAATRPLEVVEFDAHRLDLRLKVVVIDPLGFEQQFEIERIWLLSIVDVFSRAVLGYHLSLNREYSRYDVIRTIEAALEPHRPRVFTLPGVGYGPSGGFPSGKLPELGYATWQWFKLDNAKANLSDDVRHALTSFIGCFVDAGPAHTPDDRPFIERFFGTVANSLSSRLPGFTGSNPRDLRRALADPKGDLRLHVSLGELEELMEAVLAAYNACPHDSLNGRTPLEAITHAVRTRGVLLNWLPEAKRRTLCLMQTPRTVVVRGYLHQGQRPHVNFHGVRYTNAVLASTATFLGRRLRVYYNSQDLRTVRAFGEDGAELGVLKAQGAWGEVPHDLKLRQEIVRMRGRKRLESAISHEFLERFVAEKLAKARRSRRAASDLTRTLRTLARAPTVSAPRPAPAERTVALTADPGSAHTTAAPRVEPVLLRIGTGFVGTI